jgi:broad specificity phosphatase PhoE
MRRLILIKHAVPQVVPGVPPERWALSDDGRQRCGPLAELVRPHGPSAVVTSAEPKAAETGELVAAALGVPASTADGLGEHDRSDVPHLPTREFISLMEVVFRKPAERVLGRESAAEALARFERALAVVLAARPGSTGSDAAPPLAVVSHGTVIALLLAKHGGGRAFDLWRRMGLPSFAVLDLPDGRSGEGDAPARGRVVDVVERVG